MGAGIASPRIQGPAFGLALLFCAFPLSSQAPTMDRDLAYSLAREAYFCGSIDMSVALGHPVPEKYKQQYVNCEFITRKIGQNRP
jgi:hypothetical protein